MSATERGTTPVYSRTILADGWIDTRTAADYLGVHPDHLRRLRRTGGGPVYSRLGPKAIRYRLRDIEEWMTSRLAASTAEEATR